MQQDVHAILPLGEAQVEKSARALIDAARKADEKLTAELSRLEALRAVNPNIVMTNSAQLKATVSR